MEDLVASYASCGIKVIYLKSAVGYKNTKSTLRLYNKFYGNEVGNYANARIVDDNNETLTFEENVEDVEVEEVDVVRLSTFITDIVSRRKLPISAKIKKPNVIMKMDIEGAELKV